MAKYLITGSYTGAAWAAQIADPKNRIEVVRPAFEKMGDLSNLHISHLVKATW